MDILVFGADHVLLVLVYDAEQFPLYSGEVLADFVLVEEVGLLLDDEV